MKGQINHGYVQYLLMAALSSTLVYRGAYVSCGYTELKKVPPTDCGKNKEITVMYSTSRRNTASKKIWIYKPFYNMSLDSYYDLSGATNEVFFGELAVNLFGKERAAKTKFNPELRGVISRILGDDDSKVMDLLNFCNTNKSLPKEAQHTLLAAVIYSLIIEDRDLHLENLILKSASEDKDCVVYSIDHEFAGILVTEDRISLSEMVVSLDKNPQKIIRLLLDKKFNWNLLPRNIDLNENDLEMFSERLLGTITSEEFINALKYIIEGLALNDFKICYDTKDKIHRKMCENKDIYSPAEVESIVIPNIDAAINTVKRNVTIVKKFITSKDNQHKITKKYKLTMS